MNRFKQVLAGERPWLAALGGMPPMDWQEKLCSGALFPTSGTTGKPKWVQLSLEAMKVSAQAVNEWLEVRSSDRFLLALPDHHVGGFMVGFRAALAGAGLVELGERWNPERFCELAKGCQISSLVPTQVADLVAAKCQAPPSLRAIVIGGAHFDTELQRAALELGWPLLASFGMSEAASQVATQALGSGAGDPMLGLPHMSLSVDEGQRLHLDSKALFDGYWRCESGQWRFEKRDKEGFLTRDRVRLDGRALEVLGRVDRIVKVLGEQVDLDAIEAVVRQNVEKKSTAELSVLALPDPRAGRRLVLVGTLSGEALESLRLTVNQSLAPFERLAKSVHLSEFPKSDLGKIRRGALEKRLKEID